MRFDQLAGLAALLPMRAPVTARRTDVPPQEPAVLVNANVVKVRAGQIAPERDARAA